MKVIYSDQEPNFDYPSIFLAGPTYRTGDKVVEGSHWRKTALDYLKLEKYTGIVFVPEWQSSKKFDYDDQVEWEYQCLENCNLVTFWIPRDLKNLPGFTTNIEFGRYCSDYNTLYGRPDNSEKNKYLDWLYTKLHNKKPFNDLQLLMKEAVKNINK